MKRGTVNRSVSWLASRWGWSRHKTRDYLRQLELLKMVTTKVTTNRTTITIEKYALYQDEVTTKGQRIDQRIDQRKDSERTARGHIQEGKEGKEGKRNNNNSVADAPPTTGEVESYIRQGGYAVDAEEFIDYYSAQNWTKANGRPITDWKACVRSWNLRKKGTTSEADAKAKTRAKALAELEETERRMVAEANEKVKNRKEH